MRKYVKLDNAKINFNNFVQDARHDAGLVM